MTDSLYNRLGGFQAIHRLVSDFYDRVLDDDAVSTFFANTDMVVQIDHQTKFFGTILGGPASYDDAQLERIHKDMGITDDHFDRLVEILTETLEDNGIEDDNVAAVAKAFKDRRACIVLGGS